MAGSVVGGFELGAFELREVEELSNPEVDPFLLFPTLTQELIDRHAFWLAPAFCDPAARHFNLVIRSWLVRTPHHTILIDTCCGNDKPRASFPGVDHLNLPYLDRLHAAGCAPEEVDFVLCTHLHIDHCGWNTRLLNGRWVPTFPNARYLFSRTEYETWATMPDGDRPIVGDRAVFEDSVAPVVEAGLAQLVDGIFALGDGITIEPAPGHTPGHCVIRATSRGATGLFAGDAIHHPIQIAEPQISTAFCTDPLQAAATRRGLLEDCAAHGHLLIPAHFATPAVGRVGHGRGGFKFTPGL